MENTETVKITKIANGYQLTVQHDQSGSAYGCDLSEAAYEQLRLHFVSGLFCVGDIVRIRPMFENDKDRGKHYMIKEMQGDRVFIIWENYYSEQARPFWIDKRSIECVGK